MASAIEEPKYTVARQYDGFEVREHRTSNGFAKKENGDHLFATRVLFRQTFLLGR